MRTTGAIVRTCMVFLSLIWMQVACNKPAASSSTQQVAGSLSPAASRPATQAMLPAGFVPVEGTTLDPSGWPREIRCLKDDSIMVFVPAGELSAGLDDRQIQALARMSIPYSVEAAAYSAACQKIFAEAGLKPGKLLTDEDIKDLYGRDAETLVAIMFVAGLQEENVDIPAKDLEHWRKQGRSIEALLDSSVAYKATINEIGGLPFAAITRDSKAMDWDRKEASLKPGRLLTKEDISGLAKREMDQRDAVIILDLMQRDNADVPSEALEKWRKGGRTLDDLLEIRAVGKFVILKFIREQTDLLIGPEEKIVVELRKEFPKPVKVRMGAFYIDKCEVTNRQYRAFFKDIGDPECRPGFWYGPSYSIPDKSNKFYELWDDTKRNADDQPVTCVGEKDALLYAKWAGKQLPNRDQWERAARGDGTRIFPWGSDFKADYCSCSIKPVSQPATASGPDSRPALRDIPKIVGLIRDIHKEVNKMREGAIPAGVGQFKHDESPYGCLDMAGNVSEWAISPDNGTQENPALVPMGGSAESFMLKDICPAMKQSPTAAGKLLGFRTILRVETPRQ